MPSGGHQDDDGKRRKRRSTASSAAQASDVRRLIGEVALEISTTATGRAAGMSVEIWPDRGVWLRVRSGHELRLQVDPAPDLRIRWERSDPQQATVRTSEGDLGPASRVGADELRTFITRWLSWRALDS